MWRVQRFPQAPVDRGHARALRSLERLYQIQGLGRQFKGSTDLQTRGWKVGPDPLNAACPVSSAAGIRRLPAPGRYSSFSHGRLSTKLTVARSDPGGSLLLVFSQSMACPGQLTDRCYPCATGHPGGRHQQGLSLLDRAVSSAWRVVMFRRLPAALPGSNPGQDTPDRLLWRPRNLSGVPIP
jgi:hypothetical protein